MLGCNTFPLLLVAAFFSLGFNYAAHAVDCKNQAKKIEALNLDNDPARSKFVSMFEFTNDTKPSIVVTWSGADSSVIIAALFETAGFLTTNTSVYRSTNEGRSFTDITGRISSDRLLIHPDNGLQHNALDRSHLYIVSFSKRPFKSNLFVSKDSGATWKKVPLSFQLQGPILFHPTNPNLLLSSYQRQVYLSKDGGYTWALLKSNVYKVSWAEPSDPEPESVYIAFEKNPIHRLFSLASSVKQPNRLLIKSSDLGATWRTLATRVYSFKLLQQFLYVSIGSGSGNTRSLRVSTDYGRNFHRVQLPAIRPGMFYSILGVSDGLVFVHVQASVGSGSGTLYTSDEKGRRFSMSLRRHLYPPFGGGDDFYQVKSMRGTYLTTVLHEDKSMHSVITHNRGAIWRRLPKPEGAQCPAGKDCYLQIASQYSRRSGIQTQLPDSLATAAGLVLAHGHAASSLQKAEADLYISNDGGYSWRKALAGQHVVRFVNHAGVLVATQRQRHSSVRYSTDEGRCWHEFTFTSEPFVLEGLLTEPGARAKSVAIWGFVPNTKNWRIFVLDFKEVLRRPCQSADYEQWLADGRLGHSASNTTCVLGAKVTYRRLKPQSLCANDFNWTSPTTVESCTCTKEDFECEYGYSRPVNSQECRRDPSVQIEVCDDKTLRRLVSDGYRKLPGNRCVGGFQPNRTREVLLKGTRCSQAAASVDPEAQRGRQFLRQLAAREKAAADEASARRSRTTVALVVPLLATLLILLAAVLALLLLARMRERRRRQLAFHYSHVSAAGRRQDLSQYQPADGILNPHLPPAACYSATGNGSCSRTAAPAAAAAGAGRSRSDDKQMLLDDTDDEPPIL